MAHSSSRCTAVERCTVAHWPDGCEVRGAAMLQIPAETPPLAAQAASVCDDTRSTLGFAYFQALASQASFTCTLVGRHADGAGVDVLFQVREKLDPQARLHELSLDFQLRVSSRGLPIV